MTQQSNKLDTLAAKLSSVLDQHREELTRLPGVIGTGVGVSTTTGPGASSVAIQIFVSPSIARGPTEERAAEIVGREHPLEVVYMPVPDAQSQKGKVSHGESES